MSPHKYAIFAYFVIYSSTCINKKTPYRERRLCRVLLSKKKCDILHITPARILALQRERARHFLYRATIAAAILFSSSARSTRIVQPYRIQPLLHFNKSIRAFYCQPWYHARSTALPLVLLNHVSKSSAAMRAKRNDCLTTQIRCS